jgi:hypothetical protein
MTTVGIAKDLVDRQHDLLRRRDLSGVPDLYAVSGYFSMGGMRVSPSELPAIMNAYFGAFPDADNEVTDWIESPTGIAVEQVISATHTGPWMTVFGELAPTGRTSDGKRSSSSRSTMGGSRPGTATSTSLPFSSPLVWKVSVTPVERGR